MRNSLNEIPDLHFQTVGVDILHFARKEYFVLVDCCSKWIELPELKGKAASSIIKIV